MLTAMAMTASAMVVFFRFMTLAMIGRAEKGETADVNYMEVYTPLKPRDKWREGQTLESIETEMQRELRQHCPRPW